MFVFVRGEFDGVSEQLVDQSRKTAASVMDCGDGLGCDGCVGVTSAVSDSLVDVPCCFFAIKRMQVAAS